MDGLKPRKRRLPRSPEFEVFPTDPLPAKPSSEPASRAVEPIPRGAIRASTLNRVLDLPRTTSWRLRQNLDTFTIGALVFVTVESIRRELGDRVAQVVESVLDRPARGTNRVSPEQHEALRSWLKERLAVNRLEHPGTPGTDLVVKPEDSGGSVPTPGRSSK